MARSLPLASDKIQERTLSNTTDSRWFILGAGSIGCLYAAYLRRAGIDTTLLLRDESTLQQLQRAQGLTLEYELQGESLAERIRVQAQIITCADQPPIERLLICTKAHQTRDAIIAIMPRLSAAPTLVLLQNGMGVREQLQPLLPRAHILNALSTEGVWRRERFTLIHAGRGETVVGGNVGGSNDDIANQVVSELKPCGLTMHAVDDIKHRQWQKLAINCVINPLTALHRCRNGELLQLPAIADQVAAICNEIAAVAQHHHTDISSGALQKNVFAVMRSTAGNRSSMLQDIECGRRTEIDFLNGYVVQQAKRLGIDTAINTELHRAIKTLETQLGCV